MQMYPRYYKVSPRGFANETIYLIARNSVEAAIYERDYDSLPDRQPGAITGWTRDRQARIPGVAVAFDMRHWVLNLTIPPRGNGVPQ